MTTPFEVQSVMSNGTKRHGFVESTSQLVRDTGPFYPLIGFGLPVLAAIVAISIRDGEFLNFVHVVAGAVWAGAAVFFTGVLAPTLGGLDDDIQGTVTISLIPKAVLLFSGVAIATLITGPVLAIEFGLWNLSDPYLLIGILIGMALLVLAIYVIGLQLLVFQEVRLPGQPDAERLDRIGGRLGQVGPVVLGLQLAALIVMALLRSGGI